MTVPRLVLDTNILVSALLFPAGSLVWLRTAWQAEAIRPLACRATTAELLRVLAYPKFRLTDTEREDLLADILPWCEAVTIPDPPPAVPECRDADDRKFLELAATANADALITGDADLLTLAGVFSIPILSPETARTELGFLE